MQTPTSPTTAKADSLAASLAATDMILMERERECDALRTRLEKAHLREGVDLDGAHLEGVQAESASQSVLRSKVNFYQPINRCVCKCRNASINELAPIRSLFPARSCPPIKKILDRTAKQGIECS